jgi:hypothetical protein
MRAIAALFVIGIACSSNPTVAAQNPWCFGPFPVDIIDCKDARLFALHSEVESLHSKVISAAHGQRKQALIAQRSGWLRTRGRRCGVPAVEWVTPYAVRAARPCLTSLYKARIAELSKLLAPDTAPSPTPEAAPASDAAPHAPKAAAANNTATCNPRAIELAGRKCFWEQQIFQCKIGNDIYPSKKDEEYDPKRRYDPKIPKEKWEVDYISKDNCDDGDMAFFSGLLCAAGDSRGCTGVALGQEPATGRWWRSKRKIGEAEDAGYSSFSTEAGLGVLLYMVKTADKSRFESWLNYISGLPHTYSPLPSYCPHKECVFKIIDCPLFVTVASRFEKTKEAVSLCDPLQFLHLPTPDQISKELENALKQIISVATRFEKLHAKIIDDVARALGLPTLGQLMPSPAEELQKQSDAIFKTFDDALEKILGSQIGEAAARFAQQIALVNAIVNSVDMSGFKVDATGKIVYESGNLRVEDAKIEIKGKVDYNPNGEHIAAVEVFLLRNLGYSTAQLAQAASYAYQRDGFNPFFDYLVNDRARMLQIIAGDDASKCPSFDKPSTKRFQWFPERGEEPQPGNGQPAWTESMYWDCIFLANLYDKPVTAALSRPSFDPFGDLAKALGDIKRFLDDLTGKAADIQSWIMKMADTLRPDVAFCKANPNNELCKLVPPSLSSFCEKDPDNEVCKFKDGPVSFCDQNPNNDICKWTGGGRGLPIPGGGGPQIPIPLPIPVPVPVPGGGGGGGGPIPLPLPI